MHEVGDETFVPVVIEDLRVGLSLISVFFGSIFTCMM